MTLRIEALHLTLGGAKILDGVDLEVGPGERLAIMGPSGVGKSSLLRCVAGLVRPDSGRISVNGDNLTEMQPHRRPVGLMFQDYALFPHLDVRSNVAYGLRMQGVPKVAALAKADELLDLVGLTQHRDRKPPGLSGGEQQRVALARTLGPQPKVVLFDEPLGSLDQDLKAGLLAAMRDIVDRLGLASVYVTHDRDEAMAFGHRVAVMKDGRIVRQDTPENLWADPRSPFVARIAGHRTILDGAIVGLQAGLISIPEDAVTLSEDAAADAIVSASVFDSGRYLVSIDIGGEPITAYHATALDQGTRVGYTIDESAAIRLAGEES